MVDTQNFYGKNSVKSLKLDLYNEYKKSNLLDNEFEIKNIKLTNEVGSIMEDNQLVNYYKTEDNDDIF